jgi:hypothetical protein
MDKKSQENFDRIARLEPAALSAGDIDFLRARQSYLTSDQKVKFAAALGGESEPEDAPKPKKAK